MQWLQFLLWGVLTIWASRSARRARLWSCVLCGGLIVSMGTQLWLLWEVGRFNVNTAVPLHLCAVMAVCSIPMLVFRSKVLHSFAILLGVPCALLALCFPAIADCARPVLMASAFFRLHVILFWAPVFLLFQGLPLPNNPRPVLLGAMGYMAVVSLFNLLFYTNYMFLRLAPAGTPLAWLAMNGTDVYVVSMVMVAMVMLSGLTWGFNRIRRMLPVSY